MSDSWKTPAFRAAEERLEGALRSAEQEVARAQQVRQENATSQESRDEATKAFKEYARSPDAPEPIRRLYRRIASGEMTWDDVLSGRAGGEELQAMAELDSEALDEIGRRAQSDEDEPDEDPTEQRWSSPYNSMANRRGNSGPYG